MPRLAVSALGSYCSMCAAYGLARTIPRAVQRKEEYKVNQPVEALLVDKAGICLRNALLGPLVWPFFFYEDLRAFELLARGKRREDYPWREI